MLTRNDVETALKILEAKKLVRLVKPIGNWYQMYCPFHSNGQERKPSCGCSLQEEFSNGVMHYPGQFHCFSCQASHSFTKGIQEILNSKGVSIESIPELKPYLDGTLDQTNMDSLVPDNMMASVINKFAVDSLKLRMQTHQVFVSEQELASYRYTVPYMYQRKLTDAVIERYDVGYDAHHIPPGRKKPLPCVTFPVKDANGNVLFICRRSIEGKYFNLPANIEKSVYGIYELPKGTKEVLVCESVFNALTSVVYGRPAVALFGTGTSHEIDQLKKLGVNSFVLCLDNDDAGHRGTAKLKKALSDFAFVWTMTVPEGKDVNDLTKEEFEECYARRE